MQLVKLNTVVLTLCDACLDGAGGECHEPGCSMWINRAPDLPLRGSPSVHVLPKHKVGYAIVALCAGGSPITAISYSATACASTWARTVTGT